MRRIVPGWSRNTVVRSWSESVAPAWGIAWGIVAAPGLVDGSIVVHSVWGAYQAFSGEKRRAASRSDPYIYQIIVCS